MIWSMDTRVPESPGTPRHLLRLYTKTLRQDNPGTRVTFDSIMASSCDYLDRPNKLYNYHLR